MKTTIDRAGRLVIPKAIREQAGLVSGQPLDIRWINGHIEIEPAALPVTLVKKGHLLVAVPQQEIKQLSTEVVEQTRQTLQRERAVSPDQA